MKNGDGKVGLNPREIVIPALDVSSAAEAWALMKELDGLVATYKVGCELFTAEGPELVRTAIGAGYGIFLDLKYHDKPMSVAAAVRNAAHLGVSMLTLHVQGGLDMLRAAVGARDEALGQNRHMCKLLGITELTSSLDGSDSLRLAMVAERCGLDGVVASGHEARVIRELCKTGLLIVSPGIRPEGHPLGDQKRVMTPLGALESGSDCLVIGDPIRNPRSGTRREALEAIHEEIAPILR
ncbi:MAG TPA: orotidine-5'-phosphate decarboxylase [Verrucomicrobiae bacterium]|nr:orotidine-5'-phosphate decarboxylase [Verrucomicrobiae bacterium]